MNNFRLSLTALMLLWNLCSFAKDFSDTLCSANKDKIIVTYSITRSGNRVDLQFNNVKKVLGDNYPKKYYKGIDKIHTLFFDQVRVMENVKISGETPSHIIFPATANYKYSHDGYFIVEDKPKLSFEINSDAAAAFSVPLYLAYEEGKHRYKILCWCGNLDVHVDKPVSSSENEGGSSRKPQPTQKESNEKEDNEVDKQATSLIVSIKKKLPNQDTLPFKEDLEKQFSLLVELQSKIEDDKILRQIDETLNAYNEKKKELQEKINKDNSEKADDDEFLNCTKKEDYERYLKKYPNGRHANEAQGQIEEIIKQEKEKEKEQKKHTIWMVIGGILLAILFFVGNQVMQSLRNRRTQRNIMQMQQEATNRAKSKARSKVQGEVSKQTRKVIGKARQEGQIIIKKAKKEGKGNHRVSI